MFAMEFVTACEIETLKTSSMPALFVIGTFDCWVLDAFAMPAYITPTSLTPELNLCSN